MKRYRVVVTERFDRRLAEVEEFMAQRSRRHATRVVNEIIRRISTLATLPRRGRAVPEIQDVDTREVIVDDYRVMYAVNDAERRVEVLTVVPARRPFSPGDLADD